MRYDYTCIVIRYCVADFWIFDFYLSMPQGIFSDSTTTPSYLRRSLNIALVNARRVVNAKGGAEKVFCAMANALVQKGHKVSAICVDQTEGVPGFPLNEGVNFIIVGLKKLPLSLLPVIRKIRALCLNREKRKNNRAILLAKATAYQLQSVFAKSLPDVVVCFQPEATQAVKLLLGNSVPVVTMIHSTPTIIFPKGTPQSIISAVSSSCVVQVLRPEFEVQLKKIMPTANLVTIPNCVPQFKKVAPLSSKTIINIGRIAPEKRQVLLVKAFSLIQEQFKGWSLELWGERQVNPQYTRKLTNTIEECGIGDQVHLCGTTNDVPKQLARASIFAFPSEYEGFPLALTEAMSMGIPAVGWVDCPSVNKLIRDGENGILCDATPESLAKALATLMENVELRKHLGQNAKEDMKEFAPEIIWDRWESILLSLANKRILQKI